MMKVSAYLLLLLVAIVLSKNRQKDSHVTANNLELVEPDVILEPSTECHWCEEHSGNSSTFNSTCVSGSSAIVESSVAGLYQTFTTVILQTSNSVLLTSTGYLIVHVYLTTQVIASTAVMSLRRGFAVKEDFWKGLLT
jgi:hypothetical protein